MSKKLKGFFKDFRYSFDNYRETKLGFGVSLFSLYTLFAFGEKKPFLSFAGSLSAKWTDFYLFLSFKLRISAVLFGLINFLRGSFFLLALTFLGI